MVEPRCIPDSPLGIVGRQRQGPLVQRIAPHPEDGFYAGLGEFDRFEEVANESVYTTVPSSWWVLVTDVRGSTQAIEAGRYKEVMTCFIRDFGGEHLHFLDGSSGGYAMAARQLKQQLGAG